ncbi:MAG: polymerase sigma-70 factor, subfamily [Myxococcales bacterium]|nr:polymerase sigma-70 factor, subfamily [Myxococcales bacterium]
MTGKLIRLRPPDARGDEVVSDDVLVSSCSAGDNDALAELFRRHGPRVYRILAGLSGIARRDLDDLVQTTFIEVGRAASRFAGRAAVGTWIIGIALNVMRHHVRREVKRDALLADAELLDVRVSSRPDEDTARKQLIVRVQRALAELPELTQLVFSMCELEGIKGVEAARLLGMREGTLWRKLHEARLHLRAAVRAGDAE